MLTFAHIPTGTTVNKAIDLEDSKKQRRCTSHCTDNDWSQHRNRQGYTLRAAPAVSQTGSTSDHRFDSRLLQEETVKRTSNYVDLTGRAGTLLLLEERRSTWGPRGDKAVASVPSAK
jgi:hypothetical protein